MSGQGDQNADLTHVVRAAEKLAKRMGRVYNPDGRVALLSDGGRYVIKAESHPINR